MSETKFNINGASVENWTALYAQISTELKKFCREIGATPVPVIDAYKALDSIGQRRFSQFGAFLEQTGLPLAYEKTRVMLEDQIAENEVVAGIRFPQAGELFPIIRVSGFSAKEEAPYGSEFNRFYTEQGKIERLLGQYSRT